MFCCEVEFGLPLSNCAKNIGVKKQLDSKPSLVNVKNCIKKSEIMKYRVVSDGDVIYPFLPAGFVYLSMYREDGKEVKKES